MNLETQKDALLDKQSAQHACLSMDLSAVKDNLYALRSMMPENSQLMVVVKALAYGTDDLFLAEYLYDLGVKILGVAYLDEGIRLKEAGAKQKVFCLHATKEEAESVVSYDFEVGVSDLKLIEAIETAAQISQKTARVHLHIDTGMARFGCREEEALALAERITCSPFLQLEGLMSHLCCSEDPESDPFTQNQIKRFERVKNQLANHDIHPKWFHLANSEGVIRHGSASGNMARVGLAIYGLRAGRKLIESPLKPALTLTVPIVGINHLQTNETVGYGHSYTAKSPSVIGLLPIGYADGIRRQFGNCHFLIHGVPAPIVGSICMDYVMVDITHIPEAKVGDSALLFGYDALGNYIPPEQVASEGNALIYELITGLGPRIQRKFTATSPQT